MSYAMALAGAAMARLPALLPPCYSADFDDCWYEKSTTYPHCAEILAAYHEDEEAAKAAVAALPNCSFCYEANAREASACLAAKDKTFWYIVVAAAGALGGVALTAIFS
jgi:hypothetical protein